MKHPTFPRRKPRPKSVLVAAHALLNGPRQKSYGDPEAKWAEVAKVWSVIFGVEITAEQASLAMAAMKIVRASRRHDFDDLADAAAYCEIAHRIRQP